MIPAREPVTGNVGGSDGSGVGEGRGDAVRDGVAVLGGPDDGPPVGSDVDVEVVWVVHGVEVEVDVEVCVVAGAACALPGADAKATTAITATQARMPSRNRTSRGRKPHCRDVFIR